MKQNKKGFTLIELLAVIVILTIIALIAVPVIMNILDKANKSAFKDTAYGILSAGELYFAEQQLGLNGMEKDKIFVFPGDIDGLQMKGKLPQQGILKINKAGNIALAISNGRYCATKDFNDTNINIDKNSEPCLLHGASSAHGQSQLTLLNSNGSDLSYYKIHGNSVQNGSPTPENPIEIESVGEKTVNLFNSSHITSGYSAYGLTIDYLEDEDCFLINGTVEQTHDFALKWINIPITKGEIFSISTQYISGNITRPSSTAWAVAYFGANDNANVRTNWGSVNLEEADTENEKLTCNYNYITSFWFHIVSGVSFDNYKVKIQLQRGNTATKYEPYDKYKIPIIMYNEKYNNNKYTIAGNSVVINDALAGNFTNTSYINTNYQFTPEDKTWEYGIKIKTGTKMPSGGIVGSIGDKDGSTPFYIDSNGYWTPYLSSTGTTWDICNALKTGLNILPNKTYWLKAQFTGNQYIFSYSLDGKIWNVANTVESQGRTIYGGLTVHLGNNRGENNPFNGKIDLSNFYIKIDGEYVYTIETKKTTNIYLDSPLRKVGDYVDYIDFENKEVVRNVAVVDNTGMLSLEESLQGLETSIEETIELPSIPTIKGTTIIEVATKIKPSNTHVIYYVK